MPSIRLARSQTWVGTALLQIFSTGGIWRQNKSTVARDAIPMALSIGRGGLEKMKGHEILQRCGDSMGSLFLVVESDRRVRAITERRVARRATPAQRHTIAHFVGHPVGTDDRNPSAHPGRSAHEESLTDRRFLWCRSVLQGRSPRRAEHHPRHPGRRIQRCTWHC